MEGFQLAPLHVIITVKNCGTRKVRLVGGGHMTTSDDGDKYTSMVKIIKNFASLCCLPF